MGNVCAADAACLEQCKVEQPMTQQSSRKNTVSNREKKMNGCLIIKVKKVNVDKKKLEDILLTHGANAAQSLQLVLSFREQSYDLETLKSDFQQLCFGEMNSECNKSSMRQVDQDDQFKFNVDSITPQDIISIKLLLPPEIGISDYFLNMQTEGTIGEQPKFSEPKIVAQCNIQVLWLLKNKDLSHWVKLYAENSVIGQLKIKTSFFKNKSFNQNEVSFYSQERPIEFDRSSNYGASIRNSMAAYDQSMERLFNQSIPSMSFKLPEKQNQAQQETADTKMEDGLSPQFNTDFRNDDDCSNSFSHESDDSLEQIRQQEQKIVSKILEKQKSQRDFGKYSLNKFELLDGIHSQDIQAPHKAVIQKTIQSKFLEQ